MRSLRVGFFLAIRQVRANLGTTALIALVMMLTFLDLLVISGIFVGIVAGLRAERQQFYTGDIFVTNFPQQDSIANSPALIAAIRGLPGVAAVSPRYMAGGAIEANYQTLTGANEHPDTIDTNFIGIDTNAENATTNLSQLIIEGQYLAPQDYDDVLVGSNLLARYKTGAAIPNSNPLPNVGVGSKIRVVVGGVEREMTVEGIIGSKVQEVSLGVYMNGDELRGMLHHTDGNVDQIAVALAPGTNLSAMESEIQALAGDDAQVQTELQSEPAFFQDFSETFQQLGTMLGGIGLVVAFIAIFILVFINTLTRRRQIGILEAIGVTTGSIEISYALQALLYAVVGIGIGMLVLFFGLEPYFAAHPLDFPFSNGILDVSVPQALERAGILIAAILLASYIPAHMILRRNVVDAILGR